MARQVQSQFDKDSRLINEILSLVKDHAATSPKILRAIRMKWTQVGYDLKITGVAIEYKEKPKPAQ